MAVAPRGQQPGTARASKSLAARGVHRLRRRWRCIRRWMSRPPVRFIYHNAYAGTLESVPLDHERAQRILAFLAEEGLADHRDVSLPRPPSLRNLLRVHAAEYLEALQQPETTQRIFGMPLDDQTIERVLEMQRLMVGGTIQATRLALRNGGVAVNLGGGLHHADRTSGKGFCVFNDVAVAIARLRARGFREPVLIIDLDVHDGDGTRSIFSRDSSVYTYSIHAEHWGETEATASTSMALGDRVGDEVYLGTLLKTLPDVVAAVRPGLVVYVAGTDPAEDDAIGDWRISAQGLLSRDRFVVDLFRSNSRKVPMVVVLGGGYGDRAWRYSARFMSWLLTRRRIEPPANEEMTLMRYRRLTGVLDRTALTSDPADFSWKLTDEDLVGILPRAPRPTRFLGYFSNHGVELVLERFGILDQLRVRGFQHPQVVVDLAHPQGQTVRIYGGVDRSELLMELRVRRDQRVVPGYEVLIVEWLLLQNPRADFGPYRRPLPGQEYPGLGLLREICGWLFVVAEMLKLDGIYYVPSSFHVAAQSRDLVRFMAPEHEARFRLLRTALADLTLAEAGRSVDEGKVMDASTGESFTWEGFPMVLPVSGRFKDLVFGSTYEERVAEELETVRLHFAPQGPGVPVG